MLVRQPPEMSDRQELCGVWVAQVELTCRQIVDAVGATASDWMNGLGKVVGCGTVEATVRQHTQPELDSLRHLVF